MYCPSFFNCQPKQAETLAQKGHVGKNANRLADYTFCCFENQSKHCFSCRQLAVERQQQRRRKCPLIGHTNNRPSLLSIIEDLAKFGHSYSSVADRRLQSSAMQSPIGAYGLVLRCRWSVPSVLKGLNIGSPLCTLPSAWHCRSVLGLVGPSLICLLVGWLQHFPATCTLQSLELLKKKKRVNIEGSRPEWCISSMIYSRDIPFWSEILDI